jgi:hypothetical protein
MSRTDLKQMSRRDILAEFATVHEQIAAIEGAQPAPSQPATDARAPGAPQSARAPSPAPGPRLAVQWNH